MTRYLLTGSRDWGRWQSVESVLLRLLPGDEVAHAAAENGLDFMAHFLLTRGNGPVRRARNVWTHPEHGLPSKRRAEGARRGDIDVHRFPADWAAHAKPGQKNPAGPIRNRRMLDEFMPEAVVWFSEDLSISPGTRHMTQLAESAEVTIYEWSEFLDLADTPTEEEWPAIAGAD